MILLHLFDYFIFINRTGEGSKWFLNMNTDSNLRYDFEYFHSEMHVIVSRLLFHTSRNT